MRRYLWEDNADIIVRQQYCKPMKFGYKKKWIGASNTCRYLWSAFYEEKLLSDMVHEMTQVGRMLEISSEVSYSWYGCNHRGLLLT